MKRLWVAAIMVLSTLTLQVVTAELGVASDGFLATRVSVSTSNIQFQNSACSITIGGDVRCWGFAFDPSSGWSFTHSLADSGLNQSSVPVGSIDGDFVSVVSGETMACGVEANSNLRCWGAYWANNNWQQMTSSTVLLSGVSNVAIGASHICALLTDKTVKCWGANNRGQLGLGNRTDVLTPTLVPSLTNVTKLSIANLTSCALDELGSVKCWGENYSGLLGNGQTGYGTAEELSPYQVPGISSAIDVSTSGNATCAVISGGEVKCLGSNSSGMLGDGTNTDRISPVTVQGLSGARSVSVGESAYVCAVTTSDVVKCWGSNAYGQLGDGTTTSRRTPGLVSYLTGVGQVSAGGTTSCAVLNTGQVHCWGVGAYGVLGNGSTESSNIPVRVLLGSSINFSSIPNKTIGDPEFLLGAEASSGAQVSYVATGACSVFRNEVRLDDAGTCSITASAPATVVHAKPANEVRTFQVLAWSSTRINTQTSLKFVASDGEPVAGLNVSWRTIGGGDQASGSTKMTDSNGVVAFAAVSGPVEVTGSNGLSQEERQNHPDRMVLHHFKSVVIFRDGVVTINVGDKPQLVVRKVRVVLPDGTPVRGATVAGGAVVNQVSTTVMTSFQSSNIRSYWAASSYQGIGLNCGRSSMYAYPPAVSTDRDGRAELFGFNLANGKPVGEIEGNSITACYNDGELSQTKIVVLDSIQETELRLGYSAKVTVDIPDQTIPEGDPLDIPVSVTDELGSPLPNKSLTPVDESSSTATASVRALRGDQVVRKSGSLCSPSSSVSSSSQGRAIVRVCPTRSGFWYVKTRGAIPSRSFWVTVVPKSGSTNSPSITSASKITLRKTKTISSKALATHVKIRVPSGAKIYVRVLPASSKICRMTKSGIQGIKTGNCRVQIRVTPVKGKATTKSISLVVSR